jgi:multidrug efflux pump
VLLGTFGVLAAFHLTINTLNMLATVLAIGLLVDDAIGRWHCRSWSRSW